MHSEIVSEWNTLEPEIILDPNSYKKIPIKLKSEPFEFVTDSARIKGVWLTRLGMVAADLSSPSA